MATITSPDLQQRVPSDVVVVVDTSGSMGNSATAQGTESSGLNMLDIVKHAVKTIINTLGENDRLACVSYSSVAKIVFPLTKMDATGRVACSTALDTLEPSGMTNLYDGLINGLNLLKNRSTGADSSLPVNNAALLILTDGEPNVEPPGGHIGALQGYKETNGGDYPGMISTFGFGYTMDSPLLKALSLEGGGMYAFIPDSGFVGTAFVNALANILVTTAVDVKLKLEFDEGITVQSVPHFEDGNTIVASWGADVCLGSVQAGENRSVVRRVKVPKAMVESLEGQVCPTVFGKLSYRACGVSPEEAAKASQMEIPINGDGAISAEDSRWMQVQTFRKEVVHCIGNIMSSMPLVATNVRIDQLEACKVVVDELSERIKAYLESADCQEECDDKVRIEGLRDDLDGQISEAISRTDWFLKWGRHYLPSLQRAHELQQCQNFKDPGVQKYGGTMFRETRDVADDVFGTLPAPVPKIPAYARASYSNPSSPRVASAAAPPPRVVNMAAFNNAGSGCIHGDCMVEIMDSSTNKTATKTVKSLQKGDKLSNGDEVKCVVKMKCADNKTIMCSFEGGLMITPWHPIKSVEGTWQFPANMATMEEVSCDFVYSFLVTQPITDDQHKGAASAYSPHMLVNGIDCINLAHGIMDDDVASHDFFGTDKVISALSKCKGYTEGIVQFGENNDDDYPVAEQTMFVRDAETGLVCGFADI